MRKGMTTFFILITLAVLTATALAVISYFQYVGPELAAEQRLLNEQIVLQTERLKVDNLHLLLEQQQRRETMTDALNYGSVIVLSLGICYGVYFVWHMKNKRLESWARPIDGTFALQTTKQNGIEWKIDPNRTITAGYGVAPNGAIMELPINQEYGADRLLEQQKMVQATRTATAIVGGESNIGKYVAPWKFLAGNYNKLPKFVAQDKSNEEIEVKQIPDKLNFKAAWEQSTPDAWIMGQSPDDNAITTLNIRNIVHMGIIGSTNCGKTSSTGVLTAAYASRYGYHVICLDAKGGVDWTNYDDLFEVQHTDAHNFSNQINAIIRIYNERSKWLRENKVDNIYDSKTPYTPLLIIIDEFGRLLSEIKRTNPKLYDHTANALGSMMKVSRTTGMHFAIIDQTTTHWPTDIMEIIKVYFAYKLTGKNSSGRLGMYNNLSTLKDVGEFCTSSDPDHKYMAWHTAKYVRKLGLNKRDYKYLPVLEVQVTPTISLINKTVAPEVTKQNDDSMAKTDVVVTTNAEVTEQQIVEVFKRTQSVNATMQELFGDKKTGTFYRNKILPTLIKNGLINE